MEHCNFPGETPHIGAGAIESYSSFTSVISCLHWSGSLQRHLSHDALRGCNTHDSISPFTYSWDIYALYETNSRWKKMEVTHYS